MSKNLNSPLEQGFEGDLDQFVKATKDLDRAMKLDPNQLKASLENLIMVIEKKEDGLKLVFPKGYMVEKIDVGGLYVTDYLKELSKKAESWTGGGAQVEDISNSVKLGVDKAVIKKLPPKNPGKRKGKSGR